MSRNKGKLIMIVLAFVVLAMHSLACRSEEYVPPSQQNLTIEQKNALLKFNKFSVEGALPEGQEVVLMLDNGEDTPIIIATLKPDSKFSLSLEQNQRSHISVMMRTEGSDNEWENIRAVAPIGQGDELRIYFDGDSVKVGVSNKDG